MLVCAGVRWNSLFAVHTACAARSVVFAIYPTPAVHLWLLLAFGCCAIHGVRYTGRRMACAVHCAIQSVRYAWERQFMAISRTIVWTEYMRYRAGLRGFDLARIEDIVRHSPEQYIDTVTGRRVAVGRHDRLLVVVPYEMSESTITPITIHASTRQQINFRIRTGRYVYEQ